MIRKLIPVLSLVAFLVVAVTPAIASEAKELSGTVAKMDTAASTLTFKLADGKEMKVTVSAETKVADAAGVAKAFADVKDGASVKVMATEAKGGWTASSITLQ